jgi:hypothetical protein
VPGFKIESKNNNSEGVRFLTLTGNPYNEPLDDDDNSDIYFKSKN